MNIPDDLYYTENHEWGKAENGSMRVGISDYAQEELGDIVFVDLLPVGTTVSKGDSLGTVESVKAVSEVYAPVDGEIIEVNAALEEAPELVNQDPYEAAWMVVLKMDDPSQVRSLMDAQSYEEYVKAEAK
ncbi:MAG TPA: glycine cleavage system protein GcvH [Deltaproteobacteria bacterium]|mgnify:CR=1 FL=1|jgi:glycine cleavage system H protein|nr:glycine cleavage system protein GcvH [Deltaproteobacteria bacterium]HOI07461.1 glycine cleavage system protein GcvH [Deltaproteobacteria bacterium]